MKKTLIFAGVIVAVSLGVLLLGSVGNSTPSTDGPGDSTTIKSQNIPTIIGYIRDDAQVIDETIEATMTQKMEAFANSGHGEIAVITVGTLNGLSIEEFGIRVAEAWKVGKTGKDDGIIFILATTERKVRIELGRGSSITSGQSGEILDSVVIPKLKEGDWGGALSTGVDTLIELASKK